jgi:UPF0755 protein
MRKNPSAFKIIVISLATICVVSIFAWLHFLYTPIVTQSQGFKYNLRAGASFKTVANELHEQHILTRPLWFEALVRYQGQAHNLKAGEYLFAKGSTPLSILHQIVTGTGLVFHHFTIVPGSTFKQVRDNLNRDEALLHDTRNLSNDQIMQKLGFPSLHPEGQFFPDTYAYVEGVSDLIVLKKAFLAMQERFNNAWSKRAKDLPFTNPQEALVAASIIEREAFLDEERPIIAGVLVNRLKKGMLLQFDPTVIYGLGSRYNGTIHRKDLLEHTPYNTYVNKGLPPTPISMPSMESIEAVLHPDANNYLYFVASGDGASHQFSRTLAEHYAAVAAAKKYHPWFFNSALIKRYLLKIFAQKIFNTN